MTAQEWWDAVRDAAGRIAECEVLKWFFSSRFACDARPDRYSALKIIEDCGYRWADEGSDLADVASEAADALRGFIGAADDND